MRKYEHKLLPDVRKNNFDEQVGALGAEGWQVTGMTALTMGGNSGGWSVIMSREIES